MSGAARTYLAIAATAALGLSTPPATAANGGTTPGLPVAYVLLTEAPDGSPQALARVVVAKGEECPLLLPAGGGPGEPTATRPRPNPDRTTFPIEVCEAVYPPGASLEVAGASITLPAVGASPSKVTVIGDTGCKPSDQANCEAGVEDTVWPFARFAATIADDPPDLILHMGDYNYRGTPGHFQGTVDGQPVTDLYNYDAGDGAPASERCGLPGPYLSQNQAGSTDPDNWTDWWLDFFQPAAPLLAKVPWVFARGNHELCSRAGPGWLYLLGPGTELVAGIEQPLLCPSQDGGGPALPHLAFIQPYGVRLDGLEVLVLDSANACDSLPGYVDEYARQFADLAARDLDSTTWLMGHRPVWGANGTGGGTVYDCDGLAASAPGPANAVVNRTLQCALEANAGSGAAAKLLGSIDQIFAGHMHKFETVAFDGRPERPATIVAGNGGVALTSDPPQSSFTQKIDGATASGFGLSQFGYVELALEAGGVWSAQVVALDAAAWNGLLPACGSDAAEGAALCVTALPAIP